LARVSAASKKRRKASDERSFLRDEAMVFDYDHELEALARNSDNRGRRGGQFTASKAPMTKLAAIKDARQVPCRELHGCPRRATKGMCKIPCSQLCRRRNALEAGVSHGGLRVGGHDVTFRRRGGETVAGARRRRRRGARGMTITHHGGMAAISAGLGRAQSPARRSPLSATGAPAGRGSGGTGPGGRTTTSPPGAAGRAPTGQWSPS